MPDFLLKTPVAMIVFNRPGPTRKVFAEVAKMKPPKLLLVADGPRASRPGEAALCEDTRKIFEAIDWNCEVLTNFAPANLGCRKRVSSGISWIFEQVPEAIILEDDCLPDPSFFRYCQELLEFYRDDPKVMMIGGTNFQDGKIRGEGSYYFSHLPEIWGWASWRRAWLGHYDVEMRGWPDFLRSGRLAQLFPQKRVQKFWQNTFTELHAGTIDTWDFQLVFAGLFHNLLSITPNQNLVTNIGFGAGATHTHEAEDSLANRPTVAMEFPLRHPAAKEVDRDADHYELVSYTLGSRWEKLKRVLAKALRPFSRR